MEEKDDFIGRRFGRLVVLEKVEPYISPKGYRKSRYSCQCDCGNQKVVTRNALVSHYTVSCGCWNEEKRHRPSSQRKDLMGQRFGRLVALERGPNIIVKSCEQKSTWICRCDCGNVVQIRQRDLLNGKTRSCGCLVSKSEEIICRELSKLNVCYKNQYFFKDLRGRKGGLLKFDFAIFKNDELSFLLEYQSEYHYFNIEYGREVREYTDPRKKEYCKSHNIKLYEITYLDNIEDKLIKILKQENIISNI